MTEDKNLAEFITGIKNEILGIEHVSDASAEVVGDEIHTTATAFLANDDGSEVYEAISVSELGIAHANAKKPGDYAKSHSACFEKAFADKFNGLTRYATPEEVAKYKQRRK